MDVTYNTFVNTKGALHDSFPSSSHYLTELIQTSSGTGESHTNMPADLHMEHCNKEAKSDISSARGWCLVKLGLQFFLPGNVTAKVRERAGRLKPLKKVIEHQLFPKYCER